MTTKNQNPPADGTIIEVAPAGYRPSGLGAVRTTWKVIYDGLCGVWVWKTNGRVPPAGTIAEYGIDNLPGYDKARSDARREQQIRVALRRYNEAQARRTPEQIEEQRAEACGAFGPGVDVVNVLSGEKYRT